VWFSDEKVQSCGGCATATAVASATVNQPSGSSGEDTRGEHPGGQSLPPHSPASAETFQDLQGIQRNGSRETQHGTSGISGSLPCPECCGSQAAHTFESLLWGGVSGRCERNVLTTLRPLVGTATNRISRTRVSVQCDSNRHGDRHAHL
jgi:hypothetical protein